MPQAAQVATIGFAGMIGFEAALAAGRGWAMPRGRRTRATHDRAAFRQRGERALLRGGDQHRAQARGASLSLGNVGTAVIFALSALMNLRSESQWENHVMAPLGLVLAALCVIVARPDR